MKKTSYELSIIAYYLSEYDMKAVKALGYRTRKEAFDEISIILGKENNYLKLRRDEFDVLTSSPRRGWCNREVAPYVKKIYEELHLLSFDELTNIVKKIISAVEERVEDLKKEEVEDAAFISNVNIRAAVNCGKKVYNNTPKKVSNIIERRNVSYKRNPDIALNALRNADYKCEYCSEHETFIRKTNGLPYTEPHHIVPMKAQNAFKVSLDVENNIVSLCSNCHNLLHYGADFEKVLKPLYEKRKELLSISGIDITYEELKKYYM